MALIVKTDTNISLADADIYISGRLYGDTWESATYPDKEASLKMATAMLDLEKYKGIITSVTQVLAWPRSGVTDAEGRTISENDIPAPIANATAELALYLLKYDLTDDRTRRSTLHLKSERVGESSQSFDATPEDDLSAIVRAMIMPYLSKGSGYSAALVA